MFPTNFCIKCRRHCWGRVNSLDLKKDTLHFYLWIGEVGTKQEITLSYLYKYLLSGDIHLLRVKSELPHSGNVPLDYGLKDWCTGNVSLRFYNGTHESFLQEEDGEAVAKDITQIIQDLCWFQLNWHAEASSERAVSVFIYKSFGILCNLFDYQFWSTCR